MQQVIDALRAGNDDLTVFEEAQRIWNNPYSLKPKSLWYAYSHARRAARPILDTGSGLSSLVMGVAAEDAGVPVHALEADPAWAATLRDALAAAEIANVIVHRCDIAEGWYVLPDGLPEEFGLVLVDGPQGRREQVFARLGERMRSAVVICDDVFADPYSRGVFRWADETGRAIEHHSHFVVSEPVRRSA